MLGKTVPIAVPRIAVGAVPIGIATTEVEIRILITDISAPIMGHIIRPVVIVEKNLCVDIDCGDGELRLHKGSRR